MNKLSKSTVALIIIVAAVIVLGVVLFFNMPESWSKSFDHGQWMENGSAHHFMFDGDVGRFSTSRRGSYRGGGFSLPFLLILAAVLFFVFRGRRHGYRGRRNRSRAILDQMYAEEKISVEEYSRKRAVIEEEN
jgi:uncharacterized membrane protein